MLKLKTQNCNSKFKNFAFLIVILYFTFYILHSTPLVFARPPLDDVNGSTPSAVKEIRDKVKEMVRQKIEEVKMGQKRAYFGEIIKIDAGLITISSPIGKEWQIVTSDQTKIIGRGRKETKIEDLKIGDFIIAMGYISSDGILEARRLVIINKPKPLARQVAFGKVTDISPEEKILTVRNEKKDLTYTVLVVSNTIITKKVGIKIQKVSFDKIEKGDRIVAIGTPTEDGKKFITAKIIHVIPASPSGGPGNPPTGGPSPTPTP